MTDVNSVVIVGRLTADIDAVQGGFGYLQNGTAVAKVSVAVNRSRKNGEEWIEEANFFNVTIWGKTAENLKPYLKKGSKVAVKGFLKQDRWQDKQTGQSRSSVSIVADQVELCGGGQNNATTAETQSDSGFSEDIPF